MPELGTTWEDPWDPPTALAQHPGAERAGASHEHPSGTAGLKCSQGGSRAGCTQALRGQGGDASLGGPLGAECCGLWTLRPCRCGKDKVWGHFCTGGATTPLPTCALGSCWPWAGQLLSSSCTGSAEPFPPSRRPCGCSVPLKGLQAWLWDHYPIPAGQRDWTVLDSPGQPEPAALAHRGPQPPQVGGCCGGPQLSQAEQWIGTRHGESAGPAPVGVLGPIPGEESWAQRVPGDTPDRAERGWQCLGTLPSVGTSWRIWEWRGDRDWRGCAAVPGSHLAGTAPPQR